MGNFYECSFTGFFLSAIFIDESEIEPGLDIILVFLIYLGN